MSSDDRRALQAATARLEEVARLLEDAATPLDRVKALAEEAMALSSDIADRLPRVLREAEAETEDAPAVEGDTPGA